MSTLELWQQPEKGKICLSNALVSELVVVGEIFYFAANS